ncbi:MAG TPA: SDR family NAD(P)-dependent oxidoreductase [Steroidobacteraceae bacterium]|jgi:NAD(P)-dependent dehydrogenase (short-subunit alcohol dehydrogenase family)|nr:SDR family NAD(P)-dependent oxidoreductase [Steroidobacteraceae bacterium]
MDPLLTGRVAIITGAGRGLGRSHALALARSGARVLINDLDAAAAAEVRREIESSGGEALSNGANVQRSVEVEAMVAQALQRWGQVDILVNNAGILRDRTFAKLDLEDFRLVLDVHVMGSVNCTRAVWLHMKERGYGRVIFTTSSSGLFGNFGQSAYSAAKMALVGLMQTLALEGQRYGIHVNCIAPSAATAMTHDLWTPEDLAALSPERVSPAVVALASDAAPTKCVVLAGAGSFKVSNVTMTQGIQLPDAQLSPEAVLAQWAQIQDRSGELVPATGFEQYRFEVAGAANEPEKRRSP